MLTAAHIANFALMIALPITLGRLLARRLKSRWSLFFAGAATFIASQVLHLPFNALLTALFSRGVLPAPPAAWRLAFNAVVLGLSAGVFEEVARYVALRYWQTPARSWSAALMFGAGHGGIEAILTGLVTAYAFVQLSALRVTDLTTLGLTPGQLASLQAQLAQYWGAPWPAALLGAAERAFSLSLHLSLSVLVMQAFLRRNILWLAAAILWHAAADALTVYLAGALHATESLRGAYLTEAAVGVMALISLGLILALRQPDDLALPKSPASQPAEPGAPLPQPVPQPLEPPPLTAEALDDSKYR